MVSNLLADFQALTTRLASEGSAGSVEYLLEQMEPESARHLRLCAIPHQFNQDILCVLNPLLTTTQAKNFCEEFSRLPVVTFNQDGTALHDKARRHLFQKWIGPPTEEEFTAASNRLANYFEKRNREAPTSLTNLNWISIC